jgi:hypothetical protein
MKNKFLIAVSVLFLTLAFAPLAQATLRVSNAVTGNWNATATWSGGVVPAATDTAEIVNGAIVTVSSSATCVGVLVDHGGDLKTSSKLTINHGANTYDLDVHGTVDDLTGSGVTFGTGGTGIIESDGTFLGDDATSTIIGGTPTLTINGIFNVTVNEPGMTIPTATWGANSLLEYTGVTSGTSTLVLPSSLANFTWNCPSQSATVQGLFASTATFTVSGNFTVTSTGTGALELQNISSPGTLTINVGGNFTIGSGATVVDSPKNNTTAVNAINFTGTGTITVSGTWEDGTSSSTEGEKCNWTVNSGSVMTLGANWTLGGQGGESGTDADTLTVASGGTLNCSTFNIQETSATGTEVNSFTLASGGTLGIGSVDGTGGITTSGADGNIQVNGTRSFSTGANYTYNGGGAQTAGNGLPATVNNLTITNASVVTLSGNIAVNGAFAATYDGSTIPLIAGSDNVVFSSSPVTITVSGSQLGSGNYTIVSSSGTTVSGSLGTLTVGGSGAVAATSISTGTGQLVLAVASTTPADAGQSTVSASPTSVAADGVTTSTITVTVKDSGGNPLAGKTVTLASSRGATDTISAASGASDSNGHVTFTVKSSTAGSPVFTATDTTDSVTVTQTATVNFTVPAVADAAHSTVSASPTGLLANGTATSTITVTLKDSSGNPVAGKTVTLASSRGATDTISAASGISDSSGHVTFTVKSSTAGAPVFTATDTTDSVTVTQTATVNFYTTIIYHSAADGNWSATATWQTSVDGGSTYQPASVTPTSANASSILVSNSVTEDVASLSVSNLEISGIGNLEVPNGSALTINATSQVDSGGTLQGDQGSTITSSGLTINGTYAHNFTTSAGTIPTATWGSGSTCLIQGYTSDTAAPGGLGQVFYNFTWNCTGQAGIINLSGGLTNVTGNLTVSSTGTTPSITEALVLVDSVATTINIAGNLNVTSGYLAGGDHTAANIVNVTNNISIGATGTYDLNNKQAGTGANGTLNLFGNLTITAGGAMVRNTATSTLNFKKSGTQTYSNGNAGGITTSIAYVLTSSTILDMGTSVLVGTGGSTPSLTVPSGAGLITANTNGIRGNNPNTSGTYTLNSGANYTYDGSAAQSGDTLLPATVNNLTINNSGGTVSLNQNEAVNGTLTLTSGTLDLNSKTLTAANPPSLGGGGLKMEIDRSAPNAEFLALSSGTLTYGGTLTVTNVGATLQTGDTFTLFTAPGNSFGGSFSLILPGGVVWNSSQLAVNGTLIVDSTSGGPIIGSTTLSGSSLIMSGSGGTANAGFTVLTSTNITLPLASWSVDGTGTFDNSGNFSYTNSTGTTNPASFFIISSP